MTEENRQIGVYVKRIELLEPDYFLFESSVEGYLIDKTTGTGIKADSSSSNLLSYTSPFTLRENEVDKMLASQTSNTLLVIDAKFSELESEDKILMFEISREVQDRKRKELEKMRLAWAFLVPLASDGSMNTNKDVKLQLYKIKKNCKISHQDCNIFHLYADHKLKKFFGFIEIAVKEVVPIKMKSSENKENEPKPEPQTDRELPSEIISTPKSASKTLEWSRHHTQSCKVPNKIHKIHSVGKTGVSCLQFSRSGLQVAAAALSQIIIYDVLSGNEVIAFNSHIGFIYELDWSLDDRLLLSVSNDCRGAVWSLSQKTPVYVLPHPSYVYCGRWFGNNEQIITGGKDHLIRHWSRNDDEFDLVEEIGGHTGFVSSLATQDSSLILSGDSRGCVMIRKYSEGCWTLLKQIQASEFSRNVIDSIHIHSGRRRIVVSVRCRGSYLVDIVTGIVLQAYKAAVNTFARSVSSLTPCGSFLFSFCQNGDVGVWEVNTGKLFATYDNLFSIDRFSELGGFVHYHPYEHMVGISALGQNYPLLLLKYEPSTKFDPEHLGLTFYDQKIENDIYNPSGGNWPL